MDYVSRLKARKAALGMTNEQLAAASGIPMGTLSKLLAGMNDSPKLGNLVALCTTLGLSLDYAVYGKPDNTNTYTLSPAEIELIEQYRTLDKRGQETVSLLLRKECEYTAMQPSEQKPAPQSPRRAVRLNSPPSAKQSDFFLYILSQSRPVPALIWTKPVPARWRCQPARRLTPIFFFASAATAWNRVITTGDLLLVEQTEQVGEGEVGIFILNGEGYVKVWGGDQLISLNPDYAPIPILPSSSLVCCGRVVGRMKSKQK